MRDFAEAIRAAQGTKTSTEFASELGVSARTLSNWRAGVRAPGSPVVWRALAPYGLDRDAFQNKRQAS